MAALHALTAAGRDIGGPWGFGTRHIRGKAARKGGGGGSRKRPPALAKAPSKRKPKSEEIEVPLGDRNLVAYWYYPVLACGAFPDPAGAVW